MTLPLLAIGALLAFAMAGKAKAAAPTIPTPAKAKPKITISKRRTPTTAKARAAILRRAKVSRVKKILNKKIEKLAAKGVTPQARKALSNLIQMATNRTTSPTVRAAAKREVKKIVARPASVRAAAINRLPTRAKVALAKAVISAEKTTKVTADQAAKALQLWTRQGGNQGTKYNRSATVKKHQLAMGFTGNDADGIIGPKTRTRAKQLGYPLAPRSRQKPGAVGADMLGYLPANIQ